MHVRILTGMRGYPAGTVVDLPDEQASTLLGHGRAERVAPVRQVEPE